jgi:hypothetical protein
MKQSKKIQGYEVAILIEEIDGMFYATAPGIGSVYIEEDSSEKALQLGKKAVTDILDARRAIGKEITEENDHLKIIRDEAVLDILDAGRAIGKEITEENDPLEIICDEVVIDILDAGRAIGKEITEENDPLEIICDEVEEPIYCSTNFYVQRRNTPHTLKVW